MPADQGNMFYSPQLPSYKNPAGYYDFDTTSGTYTITWQAGIRQEYVETKITNCLHPDDAVIKEENPVIYVFDGKDNIVMEGIFRLIDPPKPVEELPNDLPENPIITEEDLEGIVIDQPGTPAAGTPADGTGSTKPAKSDPLCFIGIMQQ